MTIFVDRLAPTSRKISSRFFIPLHFQTESWDLSKIRRSNPHYAVAYFVNSLHQKGKGVGVQVTSPNDLGSRGNLSATAVAMICDARGSKLDIYNACKAAGATRRTVSRIEYYTCMVQLDDSRNWDGCSIVAETGSLRLTKRKFWRWIKSQQFLFLLSLRDFRAKNPLRRPRPSTDRKGGAYSTSSTVMCCSICTAVLKTRGVGFWHQK